MNDRLQQMLDCNSFINIEYLAEAALSQATPAEAELLKKIIESNCLDTRHLLLAEALGKEELAATLREWLAGKSARQANNQRAILELGL